MARSANSPMDFPYALPEGKRQDFSTTHWSTVLDAGGTDLARATAALERLCRKYWYPIYGFIRRRGADQHQAEDLTQTFFAYLLEKETLKKVDQQKGKFRTFLLASLINFLNNEWDKRQTWKRGGRHQTISLDQALAEELYGHEPVEALTPEKLFERRWACTLVQEVLARLEQEYTSAERLALFTKLEPALTQESGDRFCARCAVELGMTENAVKLALHRLRRRFGELLRSEVAHTVTRPEEVDEEIRQLFAAISR